MCSPRTSSAAKSKGSGPPNVPLSTTPAARLARVLRYRGPTARRRRLCFDWHPLPVASPCRDIAYDEQLAATLSRGFRRPHAAGPCRPLPSAESHRLALILLRLRPRATRCEISRVRDPHLEVTPCSRGWLRLCIPFGEFYSAPRRHISLASSSLEHA
jgi:hypothetical protein